MIITRYLSREVIQALLTITLVLLLAFLSQQVVRYLNFVAVGKIATDVLLELVSFEIPYLLALLLPLGLYLGILLAYGRLYADNEMAVLQMSGFGNKRLFKLTAFIAFAIAAMVLYLMLWVNPWVSLKRQEVMKSDEAAIHLVQTLIPGRFEVSPDERHVMYVEELSRDRLRAKNVFLAEQKKNTTNIEQPVWTIVLADEGYQEKDKMSSDQFFVTANGYRYEGVPGQNDYKITQFKRYFLRMSQSDTRPTHQENETLSVSTLWESYHNPKRAAELQWRFSIAMMTFLLGLLAVPLSRIKPRQGRYVTLLPAILIYIIYINLLYMARHWVEQGIVPVSIGMWWVHGIVLVFMLMFFLMTTFKVSRFSL